MTAADYIARLREGQHPTVEEAVEAIETTGWWKELPAKEVLSLMYQWDDPPLLMPLDELYRLFREIVPGGVATHELGDAPMVRRMLETGKRDRDPVRSLTEALGGVEPIVMVPEGYGPN